MSKQHSSVRAYGILVHDDRIVLVRSALAEHDPPLWWLPGGGIQFGETPEQTLEREFAEETGLSIHSPRLRSASADTRRRPNGDRVHTVRIIYEVSLAGGDLTHEVDGTSDQARWFFLHEIDTLNLAEYARHALNLAQSK